MTTPEGHEGGIDSREAGKGPSDIPPESPASEDELALSEEVKRQRAKLEQDG